MLCKTLFQRKIVQIIWLKNVYLVNVALCIIDMYSFGFYDNFQSFT